MDIPDPRHWNPHTVTDRKKKISLKYNLDLQIVVASFLVLRELLLEEQQLRVGQVHQQPQRHIKQLPGVYKE